ncbi:bile acid:sodium symporter family protein [Leptospira sp. WS58.C1]|uniref:bile acid:sodium symporter family protein n=1 Tax=Leptospira TaxID=171 RepID=UPI0002BDBDDA|nr:MULTISPECIES: sodium Bile acid symporter family protein [unclassified Leptospira]EMJ99930.1 sodium Bile acid symporter family protein [Leptospira sp. B5-022]MCR1795396.1 bile acid:sodium symporter [Leptospira sp. id769339]
MLIRIALILLSLSSMYGLGLRIEKKELGSWAKFVPILIFAFFWNFVILPVFVFFAGKFLGVSELTFTAIFLCAASPGGASGGLFVLRAKGNPALGGILIALLNGANTVLTPLIFSIYQGDSGFNFDLFLKLFLIGTFLQGLPLLLGFLSKYFFPKIFDPIAPWVERFSTFCLVLSILLLIFQYGEYALSLGWLVWIAACVAVCFSLLPGIFLLNSTQEVKASLSMVSAIRSLSLALLLAELHIKQSETLLTILMYGTVMYLLSAIAAEFWNGKKKIQI